MTDWDELKRKWDKENAEWKAKEQFHNTIIRTAPPNRSLSDTLIKKKDTKAATPHKPIRRAAPIMAKRNQPIRQNHMQPKAAAQTKPKAAEPKLFDKLRDIETKKQEAMKRYMSLEREANKLIDDI